MGDAEKVQMNLRERVAMKLLGWATWALPADHPAILVIYQAAAEIDAAVLNRNGRSRVDLGL